MQRAIEICSEEATLPTISTALKSEDVVDWLVERGVDRADADYFSDLPKGAQSAWALIALIRAAGDRFFTDQFAYTIGGGSSRLIERMVERAGQRQIVFNSPVISFNRTRDGKFEIVSREDSGASTTYVARAVIVAVPPAAIKRIAGLSVPKVRIGRLTRNRELLAFTRPGLAPSLATRSLVTDGAPRTCIIEDTIDRNKKCLRMTVVEGRGAWDLPALQMLHQAAKALNLDARLFEHPMEIDWSNRNHIWGSYGAFPPGTGLNEQDLTFKRSRLVVAGDLVCPAFAGFMEGAVRSGLRAAAQITEEL
jgi:hypothetical protein